MLVLQEYVISFLCIIFRQVARSMILDAVDHLDEPGKHEHVLNDALEDTFELLRQQYYESTSLGDGYDFGQVSSGACFFWACGRGLAGRCA